MSFNCWQELSNGEKSRFSENVEVERIHSLRYSGFHKLNKSQPTKCRQIRRRCLTCIPEWISEPKSGWETEVCGILADDMAFRSTLGPVLLMVIFLARGAHGQYVESGVNVRVTPNVSTRGLRMWYQVSAVLPFTYFTQNGHL